MSKNSASVRFVLAIIGAGGRILYLTPRSNGQCLTRGEHRTNGNFVFAEVEKITISGPRAFASPRKQSFIPGDERCFTVGLLQLFFVTLQIILCFQNVDRQFAAGDGKFRVEDRLHDPNSSFDVIHS
jgi:hypothetical protein